MGAGCSCARRPVAGTACTIVGTGFNESNAAHEQHACPAQQCAMCSAALNNTTSASASIASRPALRMARSAPPSVWRALLKRLLPRRSAEHVVEAAVTSGACRLMEARASGSRSGRQKHRPGLGNRRSQRGQATRAGASGGGRQWVSTRTGRVSSVDQAPAHCWPAPPAPAHAGPSQLPSGLAQWAMEPCS